MKKQSIKSISVLLYILCALSLLTFLYIDFFGVVLSRFDKVLVNILVFVFAYFGSFIRCKNTDKKTAKNIMFNTVFFLFIFYCVVLVDFTLIDNSFGRSFSLIFRLNKSEINNYLADNVNLIPFATVKLFTSGYKSGVLSFGDIFENIIGNFLIFAPFAFFLPVLSKKTEKFLYFSLTVFVTILIIEFLQIIFVTGSADVDDLILNIIGALAFFFILKISYFKSFINKYTFGLWGD